MAQGAVAARKANDLLGRLRPLMVAVAVDELEVQRIASEARQLMPADPMGAHSVLGAVAGLRNDRDGVDRHFGIATTVGARVEVWANYSTALGLLDEHDSALAVARRGLDRHPDSVMLIERAIEASLASGDFTAGGEFCRRRDALRPAEAFGYQGRVEMLATAVEGGLMTEEGARGAIGVLTAVQREAGARTVFLEIRGDMDGFLYDRGVNCSPSTAASLNWQVSSAILDRDDLCADPGRTFLVGFVGVDDGGSAG